MVSPLAAADLLGHDMGSRICDREYWQAREVGVDTSLCGVDVPPVLLLALRRIAKNYNGGIRGLSNDLEMHCSSLNNALAPSGNPTIETLRKILDQLGYEIQVVPKHSDSHAEMV